MGVSMSGRGREHKACVSPRGAQPHMIQEGPPGSDACPPHSCESQPSSRSRHTDPWCPAAWDSQREAHLLFGIVSATSLPLLKTLRPGTSGKVY